MPLKSLNSDGGMASSGAGLVDPNTDATGQSWYLSKEDKQVRAAIQTQEGVPPPTKLVPTPLLSWLGNATRQGADICRHLRQTVTEVTKNAFISPPDRSGANGLSDRGHRKTVG